MKDFKEEVIEKWSKTDSYKEYSEKTKNYSKEKWDIIIKSMNDIFLDFSICLKENENHNSIKVQNLVIRLQKHINDNFYHCSNDILFNLGIMYIEDKRFKNNIDKFGIGTAEFIYNAIKFYVGE